MARKLHIPLWIAVFTWGCQSEPEAAFQSNYTGPLATIGIPQDVQGHILTNAMANIRFATDTIGIDTIHEGMRMTIPVDFENTGTQPLVISDVRSHCGCTGIEWPKEPIEPGEHGSLRLVFNSEGQRYSQNKTIFVTMNGIPNIRNIFLKGYVEPSQQ